MLPRLDDWLAQAFAPPRIETTIGQLYDSQNDRPSATNEADIDAVIADCDDKLTRYRHALEADADPPLVAAWTPRSKPAKPTPSPASESTAAIDE